MHKNRLSYPTRTPFFEFDRFINIFNICFLTRNAISIKVCVCAGGGTSGAVYNPVLAFSIIFPCGGHTHLEYCFIYWLGPLLGGRTQLLVLSEASSAASLSPSCPLRHVQLHPAVWEDPPVPVGKEPQTEAGLAGVPGLWRRVDSLLKVTFDPQSLQFLIASFCPPYINCG